MVVAAVAAVAVDWVVAVVLTEAVLMQSSKSGRRAVGTRPEVPRCRVPMARGSGDRFDAL